MLKIFQCSTYSFRGHEDLFYLFFFTMQGTFLFWDSFKGKNGATLVYYRLFRTILDKENWAKQL